jgi:alkylation response protein AidB-like acyl-CoA dehydrogenase
MDSPNSVLARDREREVFQRFAAEEIAPRAAGIDRDELFPIELVRKLVDRGYLGAVLPRTWGGLGMDMQSVGVLHEEIGYACSSARSLLTVHSMVAFALLRCGSQTLTEMWLAKLASGEAIGAFALTEPNAGSQAGAIEATAQCCDRGYVINGGKKWISFGQIADVFLVFAREPGGVSSFIVERNRPGLRIEPITGMLGTRGSMLAELLFSDCEIPQCNRVGGSGFGLASVASACLDLGRYSVACGCVGISQACVDACLAYTQTRKQFGSHLKDHQLIARLLTRMITDVKAARLLCARAGQLKDAGDPESVNETLVAKYFASRAAMRAAQDAVQIHGANGCSPQYPVERYFRDAKVMEIIEGSSQIQETMIAGAYSGRGAGE